VENAFRKLIGMMLAKKMDSAKVVHPCNAKVVCVHADKDSPKSTIRSHNVKKYATF
jgi:hypothetical protein